MTPAETASYDKTRQHRSNMAKLEIPPVLPALPRRSIPSLQTKAITVEIRYTPLPQRSERADVEFIRKSDGTIIRHDQSASRNRVAEITEKCNRIKAELESRSKDISESRKADLIHAIKRAQAEAKKRKKIINIHAWAKVHVAKQCRKVTRARDKKEN